MHLPPTREHPWHLRRVTMGHRNRLDRLTERASLIRAWTPDPIKYLLRKQELPEGLAPLATSLDQLADASARLQPWLDDTTPDDVLGRLEAGLELIEAIALESLLSRGAGRERLGEASFQRGKIYAHDRWKPPLDGLQILSAFRASPWGGPHEGLGPLVMRALDREVSLELGTCAHARASGAHAQARGHEPPAGLPPGVAIASAREICFQHAQWITGFVQALQPAAEVVSLEPFAPGRACGIRWTISRS